MHPRRVLKYINLSIAVALAGLLFCIYWFAWRTLPRTSGSIAAPVNRAATVSRDSLGVPHVDAGSIEDALFLQGFVTAQDRLWQMDALRRAAGGELAEIVGASAVTSDQEARRLRLPRIAEESHAALPAAGRAALAAYARGVNFFLDRYRGRLPLEFALLRYDPRPWAPSDSILVALQMIRALTSSWRFELQKAALLEGGEAAKVNLLYSARTAAGVIPGSNAWALSGARSATGRPILANDPHLESSLPSVWYMVHLSAPGLNVTGVSLPGLPCVIIGHNERIAWGITNLEFDVEDLYFEKFDSASGQYIDRGRVKQATPEREVIRVKNGTPVEFVNWVTRRGPIFRSEGGRFLSLRWIVAETSLFDFPFLEINRARNWKEFRQALSRLSAPPSNFVYADADGNIGHQVAGRLPIRRDYDGDVPADGASGKYGWDGSIPFEQLPSVFNPPGGMIVSANQDPFPEGYPYRVNGKFAPPYRARQIAGRLLRKEKWRPEQMLGVQMDIYSGFHHLLARETVAAYDKRGVGNPALSEAIRLLRAWNGQMRVGAAEPLIATLLYQHLRKAFAERASPGKGLVYGYAVAPSVIEDLLRSRPAGWFSDYDQILLRGFADALEEGRRMQGGDVTKWDYGRYNNLALNHPVAGRLPVLGRYFDIGRYPMSGAPTTVKQSRDGFAPSMRMIVDFSDLDRSLMNIAIGQSGHVLSRHYKDQWNAYYTGSSFPMQFRKVEAREVLRFDPGRR